MKIWLKTFIGIVVAIPLSILLLFWNAGLFKDCDRTDYSPIIKKVAVPMQEELEKFHHETKRLPTLKERDVLLEKVGCKMDGSICLFNGDKMKISTEMKSYKYTIEIDLKKTGCRFSIQTDGNHNEVSCSTIRCRHLKQ